MAKKRIILELQNTTCEKTPMPISVEATPHGDMTFISDPGEMFTVKREELQDLINFMQETLKGFNLGIVAR